MSIQHVDPGGRPDPMAGTLRAVPSTETASWPSAIAEVESSLTFYDASWAATATELGIPLVSADRQLLAANLANSPTEITSRLKLSIH